MKPAKTGSLDEMLEELQDLDSHHDMFIVKPFNKWLIEASKSYKFIAEKPIRKSISKSKRFRVLSRDRFRCQACGRNPKEDNVKLEIDHIYPVSKGGSNSLDNLQTLCRDCNRGKGNKVFK